MADKLQYMEQPLTKNQAVVILRSVSGECRELLSLIEKRRGWLSFPSPDMTDVIRSLRVTNYPVLYENERLLQGVVIGSVFSPEVVSEFSAKFDQSDEGARTELLRELLEATDEAMADFHWPTTGAEKRAAQAVFDALSPENQKLSMQRSQRFVASTMAMFHQTLSVMVHGERLTSLVARAKLGDARAFMQAVQIDPRILDEVSYFRGELDRARDEGDTDFMRKLAAARSRPPYSGKIQHKAVYWGFSVLQDLQLLDELKHWEILDVFDESGMNLAANRIVDVNYLTKRLIAYKQFQKTGIASML